MADGGGLCLLVAPSGAKLWGRRYRFDGAEKNMHFGEYPRVTLKDARELHFAVRKLLGSGINPVAEGKAEAETKDGCRSGTAATCSLLAVAGPGQPAYFFGTEIVMFRYRITP
jgi:Arm DNA-binding domain